MTDPNPFSDTQTIARNAELQDISQLLSQRQARALDVVVPVTALRALGGDLVVHAEPVLTPDGVMCVDGAYRPTAVADDAIAKKLRIPTRYLRQLRTEALDLYDDNVNGWLCHPHHRGDRYLLRALRAEDGLGTGIARTLLSDQYQIINDLDVLLAALDGLRAAGVAVVIDGCDLTERRMLVRVHSEEIRELAPELLRNYRSPFNGARGADNPVVFAGFEFSNSETGHGRFTITPRLVIEVCANGVTITKDALGRTHLGSQLDDGPIQWSADTQDKALALVRAQTRDAIRQFLDPTYIRRAISGIEKAAGVEIRDPDTTLQVISKPLGWTDQQRTDILRHFITGSDITAGGVLHAVTSTAQTVADADTAHELEAQGIKAMELAAAAATR